MKDSLKHYFAIDPGDIHVGYASVTIAQGWFRLNGGVLHRPSRQFDQLVDNLVGSLDDSTVIVESFQARAVGHQRFAAGETLQLIGAVRYAVERRGRLFTTVMPGKIKEDLRALKLQPLLDAWIPQPRPTRWEHSFSAWRVLGRFLLGYDTARLIELVKSDAQRHESNASNVLSSYKKDLIAPTLLVSR